MSHYVNDPYLINGYKFDLRIYVGITSVNPLRLYIYDEGLVRFATVKYQPITEAIDEFSKYTHLTNYAVNKKNANFIENTDADEDDVGSKWSLSALWKHYRSLDIDPKIVWDQIDDIVIKTFISAEHHINKAFAEQVVHQSNCFEMQGFNVLIDEKLKVWLLEANLSASLACDTPLD